MVAGKRVEPGPELRNLFSSCGGEEVEAAVRSRIQGLADLFTARYTAPTETHPGSQVPARTFWALISGLQAVLRIHDNLGVDRDSDPQIHASDKWIRIQIRILLFSSLTFKMPTKN
jgi:hypothetical protein